MARKFLTLTAIALFVGASGAAFAQQSPTNAVDEQLIGFYADGSTDTLRSPDEVRMAFGAMAEQDRNAMVQACVEQQLGSSRDSQSIEDLCAQLQTYDAMGGFYSDETMATLMPSAEIETAFNAMSEEDRSATVDACVEQKLGSSRDSQSIKDLCAQLQGF